MRIALISFLLICCFATKGLGQKIYFSDTSNKWTYMCVYDVSAPPFQQYLKPYAYLHDTLINNIKYSVFEANAPTLAIVNQYAPAIALVRDDTTNQQVLYYLNDSTEIVLYDWSLKVGDTMKMSYYTQHKCVLLDLDTLTYNGYSYVKQELQPIDSLGNSHIPFHAIEGFGSNLLDPFYMLYPFAFEPNCGMCAVRNHDTAVSFTPDALYGCVLSVKNINGHTLEAILSPNPIQPHSIITFTTPIKTGQLTIYNSMGQKVYGTAINNQKQIQLPYYELLPGQYFYTVMDMENAAAGNGRFEKD